MELLLQVFYGVETSIERVQNTSRHMPAQLTLKVATVQHGVTMSQKIVSF